MRAAETTEQCTNRLERERERYARRVARETADERDRRLVRRRLQRRNQSRDEARDEVFANSQNGNSDMLASPSVQKKMKEFHTKMSELQFVHCSYYMSQIISKFMFSQFINRMCSLFP